MKFLISLTDSLAQTLFSMSISLKFLCEWHFIICSEERLCFRATCGAAEKSSQEDQFLVTSINCHHVPEDHEWH